MKIRAAVFHGPGRPFEVRELDLAGPHAGEVLIRMKAVGVCHSDWHLMTGATKHPTPCVPGHEGAGIVEEIGEGVSGLKVGDSVALNWAPNCGECFYCRTGRRALCDAYVGPIWSGTMLDGTTRLTIDGRDAYHFSALAAFAEYAVVPAVCCVPMPKKVPFEVAALIGCAVTTGVGAVVKTAKVPRGASVAVYGAGGVGLSAVMGATLAGATTIVAVDSVETKFEVAKGFGATHGVLSGPSAVPEIRSLTGGRGVDFAFECVGLPSLQEECVAAVRPGGTAVLAGLSPMGSELRLSGAELTRKEKSVIGSYYGTADPAVDFPLYASWFMEGRLPLERLVSRRYRLEEINEAYADLLAGKNARGLVVFD